MSKKECLFPEYSGTKECVAEQLGPNVVEMCCRGVSMDAPTVHALAKIPHYDLGVPLGHRQRGIEAGLIERRVTLTESDDSYPDIRPGNVFRLLKR